MGGGRGRPCSFVNISKTIFLKRIKTIKYENYKRK